MKVKFISEEDYKKAFGKAMDWYTDKAKEAGATPSEIAMDGLMFTLISSHVFMELFKGAEDIEGVDLNIKDK